MLSSTFRASNLVLLWLVASPFKGSANAAEDAAEQAAEQAAEGAAGEEPSEDEPADERRRHFVGSSLFMLGNLLPEPPSYYQLNVGWRPTERDTLIVEAITWVYHAPLGIPFGPEFDAPEHDFPGHIRDWGVGLAYQRFWWRGLYTTVHATPFAHVYYDLEGKHIQTGFQLFVVGRAGYHLPFWKDRLFVEPSVACTSWPIQTNRPAGFVRAEAGWPSYFLAEPGLNVGVDF